MFAIRQSRSGFESHCSYMCTYGQCRIGFESYVSYIDSLRVAVRVVLAIGQPLGVELAIWTASEWLSESL